MKSEFEVSKNLIRTMPFKSVVREIRESIGNLRRKREEGRPSRHPGKSHIAPEQPPCSSSPSLIPQSRWASLPTELILDIIQRVESSETSWPGRRDVVACASVCKSWREIAKGVVKTPEKCGLLTFPISLKQPGPRETPIQCFIRRDRSTSTYRLYLGLSPALSGNMSKLLLAGRKVRRATHTDFIISLVADDFSGASNTYIGKLRSNFMGTKFSICDSQPPLDPTMQTTSSSQRRGHFKRVSPRLTTGDYNVSSISYELNVLRTRGPRRMQCTMNSIPVSSIQEGGTAPTPTEFIKCLDEKQDPPLTVAKKKKRQVEISFSSLSEPLIPVHSPLVLKNKAPRWHEQLQCWCLNFRGRVTVASVKNFQLVASADDVCQNVSAAEQEKVILQFGKIGKNIFTMDYRYPLSTFQAFAICLSSFDTKPACE